MKEWNCVHCIDGERIPIISTSNDGDMWKCEFCGRILQNIDITKMPDRYRLHDWEKDCPATGLNNHLTNR